MPAQPPTALPEINSSTRDVIEALLRAGPTPRSELARRLSQSASSLTELTRPMLDLGLFQQVAQPASGAVGRLSRPLSINPWWATFVGVKLTGDRIYGVLTDTGGRPLRQHDASRAGSDFTSVLPIIVQLINILRGQTEPAGVGISLAGPACRRPRRSFTVPRLGGHRPGGRSPTVGRSAGGRRERPPSPDLGPPLVRLAPNLVRHGHLRRRDRLQFGSGRPTHPRQAGAAGMVERLQIKQGPLCWRGHCGCVSGFATTAAILRSVAQESAVSPRGLTEVGDLARGGDPVATRVVRAAG